MGKSQKFNVLGAVMDAVRAPFVGGAGIVSPVAADNDIRRKLDREEMLDIFAQDLRNDARHSGTFDDGFEAEERQALQSLRAALYPSD